MKYLRICWLLSIVLASAGCTTQNSTVKATTPTLVGTVAPTQPPTPTSVLFDPTLPSLTQTQAWGSGHVASFSVTHGDRAFNPGGNYGENTITDDGQMCGNIESAVDIRDPAQQRKQVQDIALIDLHSGNLTNVQTLPAGYQGLSCAVTGAWVIWLQAYGTTYESFLENWKIVAFNRQTQEVRQLDESKLPNGQPAPGKILPYPSASNGTVVWTTFADNQANTEAVRYDLGTKQKMVLAQNASGPKIWWPWVSWGDATKQGIVFENLETQQQTLLKERPSGGALNGTSFAFADPSYQSITLCPAITQPGTNYTIAQGINGDFVQFPYLNDRLVTWDSNETLFAFDRKLQRLVQLVNRSIGNPGPYISSHYMVWRQFISQENLDAAHHGGIEQFIMYVIDTNTLP